MTVKWMVGLAMFFPALGSAADLCRDSKTTRDMNQCLSDQITLAEKDLARYLEETGVESQTTLGRWRNSKERNRPG